MFDDLIMIWSIIKLFGNITLGVVISFSIVAYYIHGNNVPRVETKQETPFEDLYKSEIQDLQENENRENRENMNETRNSGSKNPDCEHFEFKSMELPTPYGTVYMKMKEMSSTDYEVIGKESNENLEDSISVKPIFMYYAKTSHIPYKYLDTLCRKYVIDYNIVSRYNVNYSGYEADIEETETEVEDNDGEEDDNNDEETPVQRDSVFANLKFQGSKTTQSCIAKDINTFKYMGNLVDYEDMKNKKKDETEDKQESSEIKLSYKEFLESQRMVNVKDTKDKKD